jgi:hypothetical protein
VNTPRRSTKYAPTKIKNSDSGEIIEKILKKHEKNFGT